ncbi:hypothetical protein [Helicobacter mustelae]|uniref:Sialidase A n=1 Tax=Helicobacter mustelae (strain ATCC 43772 / CCUG 25715 / CIP 103759 / LMG 18044 / NCTC 12198 / R85-136P) TaxID=679897 RepID=D3UHI2_HELM1|nr:hypothetical protein [Helicobacter mustelae]CBG39954.1 Putative hypothetical protein [Helicobacter mustelae 12198]SQH71466.1 sialidase A [Helicobacter mustelae]STP12594.1 sialidase A [Helicobacter mustelae]
MEALDKLKQIGIKKINQDTKISVGVIENILEKRFDKIQKVWIVGFLPIIEREYQVDLSPWLEEYNAYLQESAQEQKEDTYKIRELDLDTQKQYYDRYKNKYLSRIWYGIIGALVVILFLFYRFFMASDKIEIEKQNPSSTQEKKEQKPHEEGIYSKIPKQITQPTQSQPTQSTPDPETQATQPAQTTKATAAPHTQPTPEASKDSGVYRLPEEGVMIIEPKKQLWFQIWNLEDNTKLEKVIKESHRVEIPKQKSLIVFGHKSFKLRYGKEFLDYEGGKTIRFLSENGKVRIIHHADYMKLVNATKKKFEPRTKLKREIPHSSTDAQNPAENPNPNPDSPSSANPASKQEHKIQ